MRRRQTLVNPLFYQNAPLPAGLTEITTVHALSFASLQPAFFRLRTLQLL
jgi:hypothetical protein